MKQAIFSLDTNKYENKKDTQDIKELPSHENTSIVQPQQQASFSLENESKNIKINKPVKKTENIYYLS